MSVAADQPGVPDQSQPGPITADPPAADPPAAETPMAETPTAQAAALLDTLDQRPLEDHPGVYDAVHGALRTALAAIDDA